MDQRRVQLQVLIDRLADGLKVSDRELRSVLTADEWQNYQAVKQRSAPRRLPKHVADWLMPYVEILRRADLLSGRAANMRSGRGRIGRDRKTGCQRLYWRAEQEYERALERLADAIAAEPCVLAWLDRTVNFDDPDGAPTCDPADVPRLVTSCSQYALREGVLSRPSKAERQTAALQESLAKLDGQPGGREDGTALGGKRSLAGISNAPLDPDRPDDEWILVDGEWRVV